MRDEHRGGSVNPAATVRLINAWWVAWPAAMASSLAVHGSYVFLWFIRVVPGPVVGVLAVLVIQRITALQTSATLPKGAGGASADAIVGACRRHGFPMAPGPTTRHRWETGASVSANRDQARSLYAHLTAQAARQAVDTIDDTLDRADRAVLPPVVALRAVLRPQDDHIAGHRNQLIGLKPIPGQANCHRQPTRAQQAATTLRPPGTHTTTRPSPPLGGNGLRPAKTLVGTTGFEPATP
ncbi:hypothetical protein [Streptacidiphilus melanogenes]|uniref:hypothetical protein n=1 Tax=Streptacidiphilus melanogenes TaxID=411235 RepID=UPI0005AABED4|nr:hypothetical protein [Streptacidiphilus melanogenes]